MPTLIPELVGAGVDWLTVTQRHGRKRDRLHEVCEPMLLKERSRGNYLKPWRTYGYEGFHCGQVEVGSRADGEIARLSGECAAANWLSLYEVASGCSRLDLQLTFRLPCEPNPEIARHYRQAKRHRPKHGRKPVVTFIRGTDGSCTVYIGKRTSDVMGRIYNKGVQSGRPEFSNCLRFEIELKRKLAFQTALCLSRSPDRLLALAGYVSGFFVERGVRSHLFGLCGSEITFGLRGIYSPSVADVGRSLEWLEKSVRPTIQRIIQHGAGSEMLTALGLDTLDSAQFEKP